MKERQMKKILIHKLNSYCQIEEMEFMQRQSKNKKLNLKIGNIKV